MFHDFAKHHGGHEGTCDGLMHYGDNTQFSDCSNFDFDIWFRNTGHRCSEPSPPPTLFRGLLIVGSLYSARTVEIVDLNTKQQCQINDLSERRYYHAQLGDIVCGGWWSIEDAYRTCVSLTNETRKWKMLHGRYGANMWKQPDGSILVIGGDNKWNGKFWYTTTEKLNDDGTTEESFHTKYHST